MHRESRLKFGLIDKTIIEKVNNKGNLHERDEGVQELQTIVNALDDVTELFPHLDKYLLFLDAIRSDSNIKIATSSQNILALTIEKIGEEINFCLGLILQAVVRSVGDSRILIKIEAVKVFQNLLHKIEPGRVVFMLTDVPEHRNCHTKENCINLITTALLTFPSSAFDLIGLGGRLSQYLPTPKRRVRQALLEALATVAQYGGPHRLKALLSAVEKIEETYGRDDILKALKGRMARRSLPRLNGDGLLEYGLQVYLNGFKGARIGADVDWILSGSGGISLGFVGGGAFNLGASLSSSVSSQGSLDARKVAVLLPLSSPGSFERSPLPHDNFLMQKSLSDAAIHMVSAQNEDSNSGITLWSTESLDLGNTKSSDLRNLRGVYLGKIRQSSAYGKSISVEKGFSLLPNKFSTGSARSLDRTLPSAQISSSNKRLTTLSPLDHNGSGPSVHRINPSAKLIPPVSGAIRSISRISTQQPECPSDVECEAFDDEETDEEADSESFSDEGEEVVSVAKSYFRKTSREDEDENEERSDSPELEDAKEELYSQRSSGRTIGREGSDDIPDVVEEEDEDDVDEDNNDKKIEDIDEEGLENDEDINEDEEEIRRNSFDVTTGGKKVFKGPPSSHSLPIEDSEGRVKNKLRLFHQNGFRNNKSKDRSHLEYESDFESETEDLNGITLSNTTLSRIRFLKKKRQAMREVEKRLADSKRNQAQRAKKYRQLELEYTNSLPPTRASSGETNNSDQFAAKSRIPKPNATDKKTVPPPQQRTDARKMAIPFISPVPHRKLYASKSHEMGLNKLPEKPKPRNRRHRSLDRHLAAQHTPPRSQPHLKSLGPPKTVSKNGPKSNSAPLSNEDHRTLIGVNIVKLPEGQKPIVETAAVRTTKTVSSIFSNSMKEFPKPVEMYAKTRELLDTGDWETQLEGIQNVVRLAIFHNSLLQGDLHDLNLALLKHAKNLRSQVCRAAIQAICHFLDNFKKNMEPLDSCQALDAVVENVSPNKAIPVIIQEGIGHRNPLVRTNVARLLAYATERIGGAKVLAGQKDVTDRLLPAAVKLAQEGSLETRKFAKLIFQHLIPHSQFETVLKKHVSQSEIKNIQKFLDNLTSEGRSGDNALQRAAAGGRFHRTM